MECYNCDYGDLDQLSAWSALCKRNSLTKGTQTNRHRRFSLSAVSQKCHKVSLGAQDRFCCWGPCLRAGMYPFSCRNAGVPFPHCLLWLDHGDVCTWNNVLKLVQVRIQYYLQHVRSNHSI